MAAVAVLSLLVVVVAAVVLFGRPAGTQANATHPVVTRAPSTAAPHRVELPGRHASAARVVTTYLDALNAHQRRVAEAVLTPGERGKLRHELDDPLTNTEALTKVRVLRVTTSRTHADVDVSYDLQQYHPQSMPNGSIGWSYDLRRASTDDAWRIVDQGSG